jgi:hypothetical protein
VSTRLHSRPPLPRPARRLALGALVAVALPIAGCGGGGGGGGKADADPAAQAPASSAFYGEVTVRPDGDLRASVLTLAKKIAGSDDPGAKIVGLVDGALEEDGASFKDDIDPWLGKRVGVAITGLRDPSHPDYAIIIDATDTDKAVKALKKGEKHIDDRKYKGVSYLYNRDVEEAAVTGGDTLSVGTEAAIKAIIDVQKGGESLAKSAKLERARASISGDPLGFFYLDPTSVIDLVASASPVIGSQAGAIKSLLGPDADALAAALTATPNAIRLQAAVDSKTAAGAVDAAADTVAAFPEGAVVAAGFGNIGSLAKAAVAQLDQLGGIYGAVLAQFKTITGLDLQQDVLSWMGRGGLFLQAKGVADIGGALVVDTSSEQRTEDFIASARKLVEQVGAGAGLELRSYSGAGAKGFQVGIPGFPFPVIVATGGGKFVVAIGESSVADALKPTGALADDPQFKATAAQLGAKPAVYVNLKSIVEFLGLALGSDPTFQLAKPYLASLTALAAGTEKSGSTRRGSVVVGVK